MGFGAGEGFWFRGNPRPVSPTRRLGLGFGPVEQSKVGLAENASNGAVYSEVKAKLIEIGVERQDWAYLAGGKSKNARVGKRQSERAKEFEGRGECEIRPASPKGLLSDVASKAEGSVSGDGEERKDSLVARYKAERRHKRQWSVNLSDGERKEVIGESTLHYSFL